MRQSTASRHCHRLLQSLLRCRIHFLVLCFIFIHHDQLPLAKASVVILIQNSRSPAPSAKTAVQVTLPDRSANGGRNGNGNGSGNGNGKVTQTLQSKSPSRSPSTSVRPSPTLPQQAGKTSSGVRGTRTPTPSLSSNPASSNTPVPSAHGRFPGPRLTDVLHETGTPISESAEATGTPVDASPGIENDFAISSPSIEFLFPTVSPSLLPTLTPEGVPLETPMIARSSPSAIAPLASTAPPAPTPTPNLSGPICFPGSARVLLHNGTKIPMDEVQLGMEVHIGQGVYSKVFAFTHQIRDTVNAMKVLHLQDGTALSLTGSHMLYVNDRLSPAHTVKAGDKLRSAEAGQKDNEVLKVEEKFLKGLYNPQTIHGDIDVNGIVTSCYTTALHFGAAHALLAPVRALAKATGLYSVAVIERIAHELPRRLGGKWLQQ